MNSSYKVVATVKGGNGVQPDLHDFQIGPGNVAYVTAFNPIRCDLGPRAGPARRRDPRRGDLAVDMKTGLVRWEWHSVDHIGANESEGSPPPHSAVGLVPHQLDRRRAQRRPADLGAQHVGRLPDREGHRQDPLAPRRPAAARSRWARGRRPTGSTTPACSRTATSRSSTTAPTRRRSRSRAPCGSRSTRRRTPPSWSGPVTHPSPPLLAASQGNAQTLSNGGTVVGYGGVPEVTEFAKDGSIAVRRPPAARPALLPRLPLPLEREAVEPAGGRRRAQQHRRGDDRADELERRHRRRRLARAGRQDVEVAAGADDRAADRLRELDDPAEGLPLRRRRGARLARPRARDLARGDGRELQRRRSPEGRSDAARQ